MPMDLCLSKFDVYQGTVASNCLKTHTNSWCLDFFQKNVLSDVQSENHLFLCNIVTTGQSVRLKKFTQGLKYAPGMEQLLYILY